MNTADATKDKRRGRLINNPQFWSIASIFILITLHHYDDQTGFLMFSFPDKSLHITRHTIDRILYFIPIILSSIVFGPRGGINMLVLALIAMLPRALFISDSPATSLLETSGILIIGGFAPILALRNQREAEKLQLTVEKLNETQQELQSQVKYSLEQRKQLAVVNSFSTILNQSLDIERVLRSAIKMVMEVMQVEVVIIFSLNNSTDRLKLLAHEGIREETAENLDGMRLGEGFCGRVAKTGEPLLIEDLLSNPDSCSLPIWEERIDVQLSVPLMTRGNIIGTLCVATRSQRHFKDAEIELLSALGNLIGIAIDKSHLLYEKEKASDQLTTSEKKYRELFENAHVAIWIQDISGKITDANQAAAELFGCSLPHLIGSTIDQFLPEESQVTARVIQEKLLNNHEKHLLCKQSVVKKDGTEAIIMATADLVSNNGHPGGFQFIGRDITNELRMQENERFYLKQITNAHEEERLRISRDLHDSTAQNIIAILGQLERLCREDEDLPESKSKSIWLIHEQLKDTFKDLRRLSRDLRPSIIDDLGIIPAIEWLAEQFRVENDVNTIISISGDEKRFLPEIEVTIFRIVQETLRNISRHSKATEANIDIVIKDSETDIVVSDNGTGFVVPDSLGDYARIGKLGIDGMETRARLIGGAFYIKSKLGKGTTVIITIPTQPGF